MNIFIQIFVSFCLYDLEIVFNISVLISRQEVLLHHLTLYQYSCIWHHLLITVYHLTYPIFWRLLLICNFFLVLLIIFLCAVQYLNHI